jgi:hypothetical protein
VLDYVPADRPERFRARVIDLATGQLTPVPARPDSAADEVRAHRVDRVHDPRRSRLFSLYAYEDAALAFVQCLHLREGWRAYVPLPAPFGQERPGVHGIALAGDRLCVVHAPSGLVADIDPDRLTVTTVDRLAAGGQEGKPNLGILASGQLVINVDHAVITTGPARKLPTPGPARGLVIGTANDIWAGHPRGVIRYDLTTGAEVGQVPVADLYVVKHVRPWLRQPT